MADEARTWDMLPHRVVSALPGRVVRIEPDIRGVINHVRRVETTRGSFFVKIYRPVQSIALLPVEQRAQAEVSALRTLERHGLAAPKVIAEGADFCIMTELIGKPLWIEGPAQLQACLSWLAHLHALPIDPSWGAGAPPSLAWIAAERLLERATARSAGDHFKVAQQELSELPAPISTTRVMLHGDANVRNWLIGAHLMQALDLEFSSVGSSWIDLGMLLVSMLRYRGFTPQSYALATRMVAHYRSIAQSEGQPAALVRTVATKLVLSALHTNPHDSRWLIEQLPAVKHWAASLN